jgi:hypothetical protein
MEGHINGSCGSKGCMALYLLPLKRRGPRHKKSENVEQGCNAETYMALIGRQGFFMDGLGHYSPSPQQIILAYQYSFYCFLVLAENITKQGMVPKLVHKLHWQWLINITLV